MFFPQSLVGNMSKQILINQFLFSTYKKKKKIFSPLSELFHSPHQISPNLYLYLSISLSQQGDDNGKGNAEAWRLKVIAAAAWRLVVLGFARMGFGYRLILLCLFWVFLGFELMLRCCCYSIAAQPSTLTPLPIFPFVISLSWTHICSLFSNQTQSRQRKIKTNKNP